MAEFERTFENAAADYDESRPEYAPELYRDLLKYKSVGAGSSVLEIGAGSGKATRPMLETGCALTAIEPGERLAAAAAAKFRSFPNFSLQKLTFQEFEGGVETFDLIYAASAFHWIDEEYGYAKAHALLKSGGAFARFAYHAGPDKSQSALTSEMRELYRAYMPGDEPEEFGEKQAKKLAETAEKYGFVNSKYKLYYLTKSFDAESYLSLLRTYPDHMALSEKSRRALFDGLYAAICRHGGELTVYYTMDLELAEKP